MVEVIGGAGEGRVKRTKYSPSGIRWSQKAPSEPLQRMQRHVCWKLSSAGPHVIYIDNDSQSANGLQMK
jgi:hypothetical protein